MIATPRIGDVVVEAAIDPHTQYTVEAEGGALAPGQLLLAPCDERRRRDRANWYYSFPAELQVIPKPIQS